MCGDEALQRGPLKVFVTATAVQTGQPRIFSGADLTIDALLASACLPQLFKAVEIDGEPYWDGGYSGNPALWPLIYDTASTDLLLVKINPLVRPGTPDTAAEIADRVNEITFNAGLVAEMRAIHFVQRLLADKRVDRAAATRRCGCTWWPTTKAWRRCSRRASSTPTCGFLDAAARAGPRRRRALAGRAPARRRSAHRRWTSRRTFLAPRDG